MRINYKKQSRNQVMNRSKSVSDVSPEMNLVKKEANEPTLGRIMVIEFDLGGSSNKASFSQRANIQRACL